MYIYTPFISFLCTLNISTSMDSETTPSSVPSNDLVVDPSAIQIILDTTETCETNLSNSLTGTLSNFSSEAEARLRQLEKEMSSFACY